MCSTVAPGKGREPRDAGRNVRFVRIIEKSAAVIYTFYKAVDPLDCAAAAFVSLPRSGAFPFGHILLKRGSRIDFCHGELTTYFPTVQVFGHVRHARRGPGVVTGDRRREREREREITEKERGIGEKKLSNNRPVPVFYNGNDR